MGSCSYATPTALQRCPPRGQRSGAKLVERGRLSEARTALRSVLAQRQLTLRPEEDTRIEGCAELEVLERWLERAVTAMTAAEALT